MKLLPHQEEMIKNVETGFPKGKLVFVSPGQTYTPNGIMSVELIRRKIESDQPVDIDSENPGGLKDINEAISTNRATIAEMTDEVIEKALQSGELVKLELENPEGLQAMFNGIRERAKEGSVKDQTFLDHFGPRGKIDKEDAHIFSIPIKASTFIESLNPEQAKEDK